LHTEQTVGGGPGVNTRVENVVVKHALLEHLRQQRLAHVFAEVIAVPPHQIVLISFPEPRELPDLPHRLLHGEDHFP